MQTPPNPSAQRHHANPLTVFGVPSVLTTFELTIPLLGITKSVQVPMLLSDRVH
ncbi:MAG: hypothetical protein ACK4WM_03790 [Thermoflexales bacterium]